MISDISMVLLNMDCLTISWRRPRWLNNRSADAEDAWDEKQAFAITLKGTGLITDWFAFASFQNTRACEGSCLPDFRSKVRIWLWNRAKTVVNDAWSKQWFLDSSDASRATADCNTDSLTRVKNETKKDSGKITTKRASAWSFNSSGPPGKAVRGLIRTGLNGPDSCLYVRVPFVYQPGKYSEIYGTATLANGAISGQ